MYDDGVCRQSLQIIAFRYFIAEHGAHRALDISNRQFKFNRFTVFDSRPAYFDQPMIQGIFQTMVLVLYGAGVGKYIRQLGLVENFGKIQSLSFPVIDGFADIKYVHPSHHLANGAESEFGHDLSEIVGDKIHQID